MQNNLNKLIERAKNNKRLEAYKDLTMDEYDFKYVMNNLKVILPGDFIEINKLFRYDVFSFQELLDFCLEFDNWNGVIKNNLELRKEYAKYSEGKSDMSHILVLADDDGGSVFMITQDSPEKPTPVIWCDYGDMYYYSIHKKFQYPHDEWPSFAAFFEYLVEQEEKKLENDG